MQLNWRAVEGTQAERPKEIDTTSSPSCVYIRKNIRQEPKTDTEGNTIEVWKYEETQLTPAEYEEYLELSQIFKMPEMEAVTSQMDEQQLVLANVSANTEYIACLQELNM